MARATPDLAIEELRARLTEKGLVFGDGAMRRFFEQHAITRKRRRRTPASGTPGRRESGGKIGLKASLRSIPGRPVFIDERWACAPLWPLPTRWASEIRDRHCCDRVPGHQGP